MRWLVLGVMMVIAGCTGKTVRVDRAKERDAVVEMAMLEMALDDFEADVGRYPTEAEGLKALEVRPAGVEKWAGPYRKARRDPWGLEYVYHYPGVHNKDGVDLLSAGPDGKEGTSDDVGSWPTGK